jgi:hypothetical protein
MQMGLLFCKWSFLVLKSKTWSEIFIVSEATKAQKKACEKFMLELFYLVSHLMRSVCSTCIWLISALLGIGSTFNKKFFQTMNCTSVTPTDPQNQQFINSKFQLPRRFGSVSNY